MLKNTNGMSYDDSDSFRWTDIILGIFFFFALLGLGLTIAINFRPLYYWNIERFGIEESSGLEREEIIKNYDALIDYCSPFNFRDLQFPTLRSSVSGISHFAEVKRIFIAFYILGAVSLIVTVVWFVYRHKEGVISHLKVCALTAVILPAILFVISLINFDALFILFHKIMFSNDDWIFDYDQDPVIKILPEEFFMQCLFVIVLTIIIGSVITFIIYMKKKKKKRHGGDLIPRKKNIIYS